jgi:hypothetical protein
MANCKAMLRVADEGRSSPGAGENWLDAVCGDVVFFFCLAEEAWVETDLLPVLSFFICLFF